jgi:hypothetical protein
LPHIPAFQHSQRSAARQTGDRLRLCPEFDTVASPACNDCPFSQDAPPKGQFFLCTDTSCLIILIVNYLNLYKYTAKTDFGTDIAIILKSNDPLMGNNPEYDI